MVARTITLALVMLIVSVGLSAADEPLIGTWKLNLSKSHTSTRPLPQSSTATYEAFGNGVKMRNSAVDPQGKPYTEEVIYIFDGKENSVPDTQTTTRTGPQTGVTWVHRRIDAYTTERVTMKAGKTLFTLTRTVSRDRKTLTLAEKGVDENGQPVDRVRVYDKQ